MAGRERRIRVLLADDYLPVRDGLKRLVNNEPDIDVVAEAADGQEALRLVAIHAPDVALVDVSMPGWDGVTLAREMSGADPSLKIVAVTRHHDGEFVEKMIDAGARGYVLKQNATSNLVRAVRACINGEVYIDPGVRSLTAASGATVVPRPSPALESEPLTPLEENVLRLVASALPTRLIAEQLGASYDEILRVKNAAMQKAGVATRLEVMEYVRSRRRQSGRPDE